MSTTHTDTIFRSYSAEQANNYAKSRPTYPAELFQFIFERHASGGGSFHRLVDVGCGPGQATRDMLFKFDEVIGVDPGEQMIEKARQSGGTTKAGKPVRYECFPAEEMDKIAGLEEGSVDVLTGAQSAHWLTMSEFWPTAAKVMKPGGTVAFWCQGSAHCHPKHPRHAIITKRIRELENSYDGAPIPKGTQVALNQYRDLKLPWQMDPPVSAFPQENFIRKEWDYEDNFGESDDFLGGSKMISIKQMEALMSTTSQTVRWREAHPELVGTDEDVIVKSMRVLREAAGMAPDENGSLPIGPSTTLLLLQRV